MFIYIFIFIVVLVGVLGGLYIGLSLLTDRSKARFKKNERHNKRKTQDIYEDDNSLQEESCEEGIPCDTTSSMLEFNCAAEGIDPKEYMKRQRSGQDNSYNVLMRKRKHKR